MCLLGSKKEKPLPKVEQPQAAPPPEPTPTAPKADKAATETRTQKADTRKKATGTNALRIQLNLPSVTGVAT